MTVEANMIIQNESHVLPADLGVFSPNVMFVKTELSSKQNKGVVQEVSSKCNPVLHF